MISNIFLYSFDILDMCKKQNFMLFLVAFFFVRSSFAVAAKRRKTFSGHLLLRAEWIERWMFLANTITLQNGSGKETARTHHLRTNYRGECLVDFYTIIADI